MYYEGCKWVKSPEEILIDERMYVIIEFGSVYIPGDERSRTNPGHGYPSHSESKIDFVKFSCREDWESEIAKRLAKNQKYPNWVPLIVQRPEIQTSFQIKIKE